MRPAPCVLIVEDSYLLLEIIASLCETQGIRVIEASTGEAALTLLRARGGEIDWLFTDIHLPGLIDGWSVAHAFRSLHPDRPVVYTSTDANRRRGVPRQPVPAQAVPGPGGQPAGPDDGAMASARRGRAAPRGG